MSDLFLNQQNPEEIDKLNQYDSIISPKQAHLLQQENLCIKPRDLQIQEVSINSQEESETSNVQYKAEQQGLQEISIIDQKESSYQQQISPNQQPKQKKHHHQRDFYEERIRQHSLNNLQSFYKKNTSHQKIESKKQLEKENELEQINMQGLIQLYDNLYLILKFQFYLNQPHMKKDLLVSMKINQEEIKHMMKQINLNMPSLKHLKLITQTTNFLQILSTSHIINLNTISKKKQLNPYKILHLQIQKMGSIEINRCTKSWTGALVWLKFSSFIHGPRDFLYPNSFFKKSWDVCHIFAILLVVIFIPMDMVNENIQFAEEYPVQWFALMWVGLVVFITDVIITLNTGYYDKGLIIWDKVQIRKKYVTNYFLIDILGITPLVLELFQVKQQLKLWNLLILFKFLTLNYVLEDFKDLFLKNRKVYNILSLIQLLFYALFVAHIFGCLFQLVPIIERMEGIDITWTSENGLDDSDWYRKYINSLYFSITTMTSVGYGDLTPQNKYEKAFVTVGMLISCGMFAYTFNLIGVIVDDMKKQSKEFNKEMSLFNAYLEKKQIKYHLRMRVQNYVKYKLRQNLSLTAEQEDEVLCKLSKQIREEIIVEGNLNMMQKCQIRPFDRYSHELQRKIAQKLVQRRYTKNEIANPLVYFLEEGEVSMYIETSDQNRRDRTELAKIYESTCFGQYSFYTMNQRRITAKVTQFSTIYYLEKNDFLEILKDHPQDYEIYCEIKDKLTFNQYNKLFYTTCYVCQKKDHLMHQCPYIQLQIDKQRLILKSNYSISNERNHNITRRTEEFRLSSRFENFFVQEAARTFCAANIQNSKLQEIQNLSENKDCLNRNKDGQDEEEDEDEKSSCNKFFCVRDNKASKNNPTQRFRRVSKIGINYQALKSKRSTVKSARSDDSNSQDSSPEHKCKHNLPEIKNLYEQIEIKSCRHSSQGSIINIEIPRKSFNQLQLDMLKIQPIDVISTFNNYFTRYNLTFKALEVNVNNHRACIKKGIFGYNTSFGVYTFYSRKIVKKPLSKSKTRVISGLLKFLHISDIIEEDIVRRNTKHNSGRKSVKENQ